MSPYTCCASNAFATGTNVGSATVAAAASPSPVFRTAATQPCRTVETSLASPSV